MPNPSTLEDFASMLGAGNQSSLIERGSQVLSSLLGGRDQSALAGAIAKYTGVSQGAVSSMLEMLAPVVAGAMARQLGATRPGRISSLLASQRDNIAAACPSQEIAKSMGSRSFHPPRAEPRPRIKDKVVTFKSVFCLPLPTRLRRLNV